MSEWIDCKKELPQVSYLESDNEDDPYEAYNVLLLGKFEKDIFVGYLVKEQDEDSWNVGDLSWETYIPTEGGSIENIDFDQVTHWMPLPNLPISDKNPFFELSEDEKTITILKDGIYSIEGGSLSNCSK